MEISYDLHIHSCLSPCGDDEMTPWNLVGMAKVLGLDAIALTDHNTAKNCPAFLQVAAAAGIRALPGMELNTSEEIHTVCLFRKLENALAFDRYVWRRRLAQGKKFTLTCRTYETSRLCLEISGSWGKRIRRSVRWKSCSSMRLT